MPWVVMSQLVSPVFPFYSFLAALMSLRSSDLTMLYWALSDLKAELHARGAVRGGMRGPGMAGVQFALGCVFFPYKHSVHAVKIQGALSLSTPD